MTLSKANDALWRAHRAISENRPIEVENILIEHLDDLLHTQSFKSATYLLDSLDANVFPPSVLTGALTVTRHAREALGAARVDFLMRVESALAARWQQPAELVASTIQRLR